MDGSQMVKRDTSSTDPPNAVLMAVQEWQRAKYATSHADHCHE